MTPRLLCLCAIVLACAPVPTVNALQTILASSPLVEKMGRTFPGPASQPGSVSFEWLGGGFRLAHTGSTLWATPTNTTHAYKLSYAQTDGSFLPPQGVSWVTPQSVAANTSVVVAYGSGTVRVTLNVAPQYWARPAMVPGIGRADSESVMSQAPGNLLFREGARSSIDAYAGIYSFTTDGEFVAPTPLKRNLHFLGDSISAATNIHGLGQVSCGDNGLESDYLASWAGLLCTMFDTNCTTLAVGGKGLVKNCCNSGPPFIPEYYTRLKYSDSLSLVDFRHEPVPDALLVYLGTNDYSAGGSADLDAEFTAGYMHLLHNVSRVWFGTPQSPANITFFAVLGPMSPTLPANATLAAVQQARAQGYNIYFVNATTACGPELTGCTDGCAHHPGVVGHRNLADIVAPVLKAALGW